MIEVSRKEFLDNFESAVVENGEEAALRSVLNNVTSNVAAAFKIGYEYCERAGSKFTPQSDLSNSSFESSSRKEAIRELAEQIVVESEFYLKDCGTVIEKDASEVTALDFERLLNGAALGLVIHNLIDASSAANLAKALADSHLESNYSNLRDDLTKIGFTLFEAVCSQSSDQIGDYLKRAREFESLIDSVTAPLGGSPMESAKAMLNRFGNASPLPMRDTYAFAGLVRMVQGGSEIYPHQDDLTADLPGHPFVEQIQAPGGGQLAGNVYLQVPPSGGDLVIWDLHLSEAEMEARKIEQSDYGVDPKTLPSPTVVIRPNAGDMILFDSTRMHAVTKPSEGLRVSFSFFVGAAADGTIHYWS